MLKIVPTDVWVIDAEWVADPATGRRVLGLPNSMPDAEVIDQMFMEGGATAENPRPYLKTVLCQIVSIGAVLRHRDRATGKIQLTLHSVPSLADKVTMTEAQILDRFLTKAGRIRPQLVGFNSIDADLPAILQRALVHGLYQPQFCSRPDKPWEGVDYFAKFSDWHVDLKQVLSGWGKATPSLHELAAACGIPGKTDVAGDTVIDRWLAGDLASIVKYQQLDALRTYLVWLRVALLAGKVNPEEHAAEEETLAQLLTAMTAAPGQEHLVDFLARWERLTPAPVIERPADGVLALTLRLSALLENEALPIEQRDAIRRKLESRDWSDTAELQALIDSIERDLNLAPAA